ncbi:hypothetical protein CDAR_506421 [Caerostris darwini]|uniref:Uncharacterized protein n=1 Tax=Caerostris darwini TaxID=1538125 RepID=A0AAV4QBR9_9ARAC|nr:hypothetical protein CDAR_506421 [Caerostris darwini]
MNLIGFGSSSGRPRQCEQLMSTSCESCKTPAVSANEIIILYRTQLFWKPLRTFRCNTNYSFTSTFHPENGHPTHEGREKANEGNTELQDCGTNKVKLFLQFGWVLKMRSSRRVNRTIDGCQLLTNGSVQQCRNKVGYRMAKQAVLFPPFNKFGSSTPEAQQNVFYWWLNL